MAMDSSEKFRKYNVYVFLTQLDSPEMVYLCLVKLLVFGGIDGR